VYWSGIGPDIGPDVWPGFGYHPAPVGRALNLGRAQKLRQAKQRPLSREPRPTNLP
jgi:hypothetical protein